MFHLKYLWEEVKPERQKVDSWLLGVRGMGKEE